MLEARERKNVGGASKKVDYLIKTSIKKVLFCPKVAKIKI